MNKAATQLSATLELAMELIRRKSVSPVDAGCQAIIAKRLEACGFKTESMPFGDVDNLWACHGDGRPMLAFLGHTDVVPPGPEADWSSPPFEPVIRNGMLYGRGAADMKGSVAAMVTACERFVTDYPDHRGCVALLLTSDEEGPAVDGTVKVVDALTARGEHIDYCVVGEPSSLETLGDVVRIGRRGSLVGEIVVHGVQGHSAYPERALNPIHAFAPALNELCATEWDVGDEHFPPSICQFTNINAGTGAANVIPGQLRVTFNIRHGAVSTASAIQNRIRGILDKHGLKYDLNIQISGVPFITADGDLYEAVRDTMYQCLGVIPRRDTGGGTSDGRFVAPTGAQVIEVGPVNLSIHKVDEHVRVDDLDRIADVYHDLAKRLLVS